MDSPWAIILMVLTMSVLLIPFTHIICKGMLRMDVILPRWAEQNGYQIIRQEYKGSGPLYPFYYPPRHLVYYVVVEDREGNRRTGWVCFGGSILSWMFSDEVEVRWEEGPGSAATR